MNHPERIPYTPTTDDILDAIRQGPPWNGYALDFLDVLVDEDVIGQLSMAFAKDTEDRLAIGNLFADKFWAAVERVREQ